MSHWMPEPQPPAGWSEACDHNDCLFHGDQWMAVLESGLSESTAYLLNDDLQRSAAIAIFRAGPFRIGYLGFPVGGLVGSTDLNAGLVDALRSQAGSSELTAIRLPVSGFAGSSQLDLPYVATPESAIVELQSWNLDLVSKNRKRDVKRSQKSGLTLVDATDTRDAARIFSLYQSTLKRHDGSLRYTEAYFRSLIGLAGSHPRMRVLLARKDEVITAFLVVALHQSTGYYLHGAFDWAQRSLRPSALLMYEAIEWARACGCKSFNFLSSPKGQVSLVKYKEGWGATTKNHRTYTLPLRPSYYLFKTAEYFYRLVR